MEYRRRRTKRRSAGRLHTSRAGNFSGARSGAQGVYSRAADGSGGSIFNIFLLLILLAALIYVVVATPVGAWLVKKVIRKAPSGEPDPSGAPVLTSEPTQSASVQTASPDAVVMQLPALDMYALQLGVYDDPSNAQGMINSLKSLGAAGYAYNSGEGFRILAACYTTEAAAKSVSTRLTEQGYSCIVYPLHCDGIELGVVARDDQLQALRAAVDYSMGLINDLNEEVLRFDTEQRSIEYGIAIINEMLTNIRAIRTALASGGEPSGAMMLIDQYFMSVAGAAQRLTSPGTDNRVEFSGMLKAFQIEAVETYIRLLNELRRLSAASP